MLQIYQLGAGPVVTVSCLKAQDTLRAGFMLSDSGGRPLFHILLEL